jgi:hypothetical protein
MNEKTKTGLEILEAAILLGLLGDALLRATPWGLNVLLWIAALVAAMIALTFRRKREFWRAENIWLHGALVGFAALFVWRDSLTLQVLDVLIMLAILSILTLPALGLNAKLTGFLQYAGGAVYAGLNIVFAPFFLVFGDIKWKTIPQTGWLRHASAVLRGLAIAAPILLVFGALFMAADAVFEGIVKNTLNINPDILFSHFLLFGFFAWITAGYLRGALFEFALNNFAATTPNAAGSMQTLNLDEPVTPPKSVTEISEQPNTDEAEKKAEPIETKIQNNFFSLGAIEIGIVLGLINLLFFGFVLVQLRYFFGGMDLVQTTPDFKLAEYARRGFFELCWVAGLMLPILLTAHWLMRKNEPRIQNLFRVLSIVNIGLLFVIMFSAVERMLLYTGSLGYGLTTMRLYPTAFMLWLALVFVWFGLTVLRNQPNRFAWGAFWTALLIVGSLHVLNPDKLIVKHNVRLMEQGRQFDAWYNSSLSDDSVLTLVEALPQMSFENQCIVKNDILDRLKKIKSQDFRTFNFSRWKAQEFLLNYEGSFDTIGCSKDTKKVFVIH